MAAILDIEHWFVVYQTLCFDKTQSAAVARIEEENVFITGLIYVFISNICIL
jgi:hypothetical protein